MINVSQKDTPGLYFNYRLGLKLLNNNKDENYS